MELTREQIERIRMWLERRCMLDTEMNRLCDMALRSLQSDSQKEHAWNEGFFDAVEAADKVQSDSRAVEVLRELVRLKDMRDRMDVVFDENDETDPEWQRLREEYDRCKPLAWEAARSVLSPPAPDDQDSASDVRKEALVSHDAAAHADMVWVPKEATDEMEAAGYSVYADIEPGDARTGNEIVCQIYEAMIVAAPGAANG
jgi:hypothetical protein